MGVVLACPFFTWPNFHSGASFSWSLHSWLKFRLSSEIPLACRVRVRLQWHCCSTKFYSGHMVTFARIHHLKLRPKHFQVYCNRNRQDINDTVPSVYSFYNTFEIVLNATFYQLDGKFKTFSIIELNGPSNMEVLFHRFQNSLCFIETDLLPTLWKNKWRCEKWKKKIEFSLAYGISNNFLSHDSWMLFFIFYKIMGHNWQCYRTRLAVEIKKIGKIYLRKKILNILRVVIVDQQRQQHLTTKNKRKKLIFLLNKQNWNKIYILV